MMNEQLPRDSDIADSSEGAQQSALMVPDQVPLFQAGPSQVDDSTRCTEAVSRFFFPANREDALILLGGLCISVDLPDVNTRLAMANGAPALLPDGLRASEMELLSDGRKERFPVLMEIDPCSLAAAQPMIGFDQIARLIFRTQEDADAFRFRPVDEFDPGGLEYLVDAACFDLEGDPRFAIRQGELGVGLRHGFLADRLACALHYLLLLGESRPECRRAAFEFLSGSVKTESVSPNFASICEVLEAQPTHANLRQLHAVVHTFLDADIQAPGALVEGIAQRLDALEASDDRVRDTEARWVAIARDVVRNRVALDGDLLTDDKSVLLRGTLLALMPEGVQEVATFLDSKKPAGVKVVTFAAFLIGLKVGILNTTWATKGPDAFSLADVCRQLLQELANVGINGCTNVITTVIDEEADSTILRVQSGTHEHARWTVAKVLQPDPIEQQWLDDFTALDYRVLGCGRHERSWTIALTYGSTVEIRHCEVDGRRFPMFRYRLDHGEKLRRPTEIAAAFATGGHLWLPRKDDDGVLCLCCELHVLPARADIEWIIASLERAKGLCIATAKPPRKRSIKTKNKELQR